ncbi:MAG: uroporphyrinogen decarboxylase family protein [Verrucomicrobiota bacterium]
MGLSTPQDAVLTVLKRQRPARLVYAPNYWQWYVHQRNHGHLPGDIRSCRSQLELIRQLGLEVFSRNVYCDEQRGWFGGLCDEVWTGVDTRVEETFEGKDRLLVKTYQTRKGTLTERQRYVFAESTLVQEQFAVDNLDTQLAALEELVAGRRWRFVPERYAASRAAVGKDGVVVAGEVFSPLKLLHLLVGAVNTTFLIMDHGDQVREILARHESAQLDLIRQMAAAGVPAIMAMDNLDAAFHTPAYVDRFSASFYEKASRLCHEYGSTFFIHACGRQRVNLKRIDALGVDGLEGVAFPPLGDVTLLEAMQMTRDRFLITGGISAMETRNLKTRADVFEYTRQLADQMRPFAHRFMLSASCNTPIDARWETLCDFRDAWREFGTV